MSADHELILLSGTANEPLTRAIRPFCKRWRGLYYSADLSSDVDRSYTKIHIMVDAARCYKVKMIISVMPYFGYGRQDRKDKQHAAISAKVMVRNLEVNHRDHFVTVDIHSERTEDFFDIYFDNLQASYCFIPRLRQLGLSKKPRFVFPDLGGGSRAGAYDSRFSGKGMAVGYKIRDYEKRNTSSTSLLVGSVRGCDVGELIAEGLID